MKNHYLKFEFPKYAEKINFLREKSGHFKHLSDEYEDVNDKIHHYESGEQSHTTDKHLTELRKQRLHLKDELYNMLHED